MFFNRISNKFKITRKYLTLLFHQIYCNAYEIQDNIPYRYLLFHYNEELQSHV